MNLRRNKVNSEFNKFDEMTRKLLKVPHAEVKKELEREKAEKQKRKANKVKSRDH